MDLITRCRAMAAFCRQRAKFEGENDAFWITEAEEWDRLISQHADPHAEEHKSRATGPVWRPAIGSQRTNGISLFRYNCPLSSSQQSSCRGFCELILERIRSPSPELTSLLGSGGLAGERDA